MPPCPALPARRRASRRQTHRALAALVAALLGGAAAGTAAEPAPPAGHPAGASARPLEAPGPQGALAGTLQDAGAGRPVALLLAGSGPTDRDGNSALGVRAAPLRLLAEGLAAAGISSLRADKRGMLGSRAAVGPEGPHTVGAYAEDAARWVRRLRTDPGADCVWLIGHSEGGLVALLAAQDPVGLCGLVLLATPGRPLGTLLREQFRANPANGPLLPALLGTLDALEAGRPVELAGQHPAVQALFAPANQPYFRDALPRDPTALAAALRRPVLVVQGERDLQVLPADAAALAAAAPAAERWTSPAMNHVLKTAPADRAGNLATYADATLPLAPGLVQAVAGFIQRHTPAR